MDKIIFGFIHMMIVNHLRLRHESWLPVPGHIERATVMADEYGYTYAELAYSYSYESEYHSGFFKQYFFREASAEEFADRFRSGLSVQVRVNPDRAEASVLDHERMMIG